jgi:hypothetical protein
MMYYKFYSSSIKPVDHSKSKSNLRNMLEKDYKMSLPNHINGLKMHIDNEMNKSQSNLE